MERVKCDLCPNFCSLKPGQKGICGARGNINGSIKSLTYGLFSAIHLDPVEKKPLYHVKPGSMTLSLGSIGCNLKCPWCQNYGISQETSAKGLSKLETSELLEICKEKSISSVSFTYNEPLLNYEYIVEVSKLLKDSNIDTYLVTAGYVNPKYHETLFKNITAVNIDLKSFSYDIYTNYIKGNLETILETIKYLVKSKIWTEITNLIIPNLNDSEEEVIKMGEWIFKELGDKVPLHLSAFYPTYKMTDRPRTSPDKLIELKNTLKNLGLKYIYLGNILSRDGSTTYCPNCNKAVIERSGFSILRNKLKGNRCPSCSNAIEGIF